MLSKIVLKITLPAAIIVSFAGKEIDPSMLVLCLLCLEGRTDLHGERSRGRHRHSASGAEDPSCPACHKPVFYNSFLFSEPGVVTMTFSGVMTSAPFAVAAPLNIFSTMALKAATTSPSVRYSAFPLI